MKSNLIVFLAVFAIKLGLGIYMVRLGNCAHPPGKSGMISITTGDTFSYTGAMENYVSEGNYYFNNGDEDVRAGRLPHYSVPYYIFRFLGSPEFSHDLTVLLQLILECISILCIGYLVYHYTQSNWLYYASLAFLALSYNTTFYSFHISPESVSTSFMALFFWSIVYFKDKSLVVSMAWPGLFLGLLVCMKPYFALGYIPLGLSFFPSDFKSAFKLDSVKQILIKTVLVSTPLIFLLTPWVIRNSLELNAFIPLQESSSAGYKFNKADVACANFIRAFGGNTTYWERTSAGCYFRLNRNCAFTFPDYVYSNNVTPDAIEEVRQNYFDFQQSNSPELDSLVTSQFNSLTASFISEKSFRYYVISPLVLIKSFFTHSGSYYLPIHSGNPCYKSYQITFKLLQSFLYWISFLGGWIGLVFWARKYVEIRIMLFFPILIIGLFPIILRNPEWRYFASLYPIFVVGMFLVIDKIWTKVKAKLNI